MLRQRGDDQQQGIRTHCDPFINLITLNDKVFAQYR